MSPPASQADIDHILAHTLGLWDEVRGARIFVTGGTGFVGTWIMEALVAANAAYDLRVQTILLTRDPSRFRARAPHLAGAPGVSFATGDTADFTQPDGPFSHVIHAATERNYVPDTAHPLGILADDALATRRVLDLCVAAGTRKLLFTSSGAVYGPQPPQCTQVAESDPFAPDTTDTQSAYGQSKRLSEFSCIMHGSAFGFSVTIARLFAFVGPHLPLTEGYAVGNFLCDAVAGKPIRITGDGTPLRSYLYAADLAVWLWHVLLRGASGRAYNVGSPHALSIAELARAVVTSTNRDVPIQVAETPLPSTTPLRYVPSTERAERELSVRAVIDLPEALRRTYEWYRLTDHSGMAAVS